MIVTLRSSTKFLSRVERFADRHINMLRSQNKRRINAQRDADKTTINANPSPRFKTGTPKGMWGRCSFSDTDGTFPVIWASVSFSCFRSSRKQERLPPSFPPSPPPPGCRPLSRSLSPVEEKPLARGQLQPYVGRSLGASQVERDGVPDGHDQRPLFIGRTSVQPRYKIKNRRRQERGRQAETHGVRTTGGEKNQRRGGGGGMDRRR